jgi:hypothetical protein
VKAIKSDNEGLKVSALRLVIKHGDKVNVEEATLGIVELYRRSDNEQFRQLALAVINATQNEWALNIVARDYQFETNPTIKNMKDAILIYKVGFYF